MSKAIIENKGKRSFSLSGDVLKAGAKLEIDYDVAKELAGKYPKELSLEEKPAKKEKKSEDKKEKSDKK